MSGAALPLRPKKLITFDIDGTLCKSDARNSAVANAMHTKAFSHAFREVFGIDASIDEIPHHGSTDQLILLKVLMNRGFKKEEIFPRLPELTASMVQYAESNKGTAGEGLELLPGVKETLAALKERDDVIFGLVTGNLEQIAWIKMEALGVKEYFSSPRFGGFGSDYCSGDVDSSFHDRAEFIRIARARAAERHGLSSADFREQFHIGDAPTDMQAAELAGANAVGVATGIFSAPRLQELCSRPGSSVLPGLGSLPATLAALGLSAGAGPAGSAAASPAADLA